MARPCRFWSLPYFRLFDQRSESHQNDRLARLEPRAPSGEPPGHRQDVRRKLQGSRKLILIHVHTMFTTASLRPTRTYPSTSSTVNRWPLRWSSSCRFHFLCPTLSGDDDWPEWRASKCQWFTMDHQIAWPVACYFSTPNENVNRSKLFIKFSLIIKY